MKSSVLLLVCCTVACIDSIAGESRAKRQTFASCFDKAGAYCDYSCKTGYSEDPTLRCGVVTTRKCCVQNTTPPPSMTTITPPLNTCGVSKFGSMAGQTTASSTNRIVGGEDAYANEFPWLVSLQLDNEHMCGGAIISKNWILTAAHCFEDLNVGSSSTLSRLRIVAGEHRLLNSDGTEVYAKIAKVIIHPSYNTRTSSNDIALIKLSTSLTFNSNVRDACLPNSTANFERQITTAAGWGLTVDGGFFTPNTVKKVQLVTITNSQCKTQLSGQGTVDATMLCASGNAKDTCQGDSGGPLMYRSGQQITVVGVVSWGIGCASGLPGVYAKVSYFVNWIATTTANN